MSNLQSETSVHISDKNNAKRIELWNDITNSSYFDHILKAGADVSLEETDIIQSSSPTSQSSVRVPSNLGQQQRPSTLKQFKTVLYDIGDFYGNLIITCCSVLIFLTIILIIQKAYIFSVYNKVEIVDIITDNLDNNKYIHNITFVINDKTVSVELINNNSSCTNKYIYVHPGENTKFVLNPIDAPLGCMFVLAVLSIFIIIA